MKPITVALVGALALASLAGCETSVTTTGTPASARAVNTALPPPEALAKSVKALGTTAFNVAVKQGVMTGGGRVDPAAGKAVLSMGGNVDLGAGVGVTRLSLGYTVLAPELYIKADFGDTLNEHYGMDPTTWMHVDRAKLTGNALPLSEDGKLDVGITELLSGTADVQRTDKTHYTGTIDVSAVRGSLAPTQDSVQKAGAKAKAIPFKATLDEEGRLTVFTIDGASIDEDLAMELTFTGYGSIDPVTVPAGAIECPASVYELIG
nr:hypothetical protein GCM10020063_055430 [Dactylosporangium thailandense]